MNKKMIYMIVLLFILAMGSLVMILTHQKTGSFETEKILRIGGSTTLYQYIRTVAEAYMEEHEEMIITVSESSTGDGIKGLIEKDLDIACASRLPKPKEYKQAKDTGHELKVTLIGKDAVVVIIHPSKAQWIQKITQAELKSIFFDGTITDWSQLNSNLSGSITVYTRDPKTSGTASLFAEKITGSATAPYITEAQDVHITPLVVPALAENPSGIAYTPLKWVTDEVKIVPYAENQQEKAVFPSLENIKNNQYALTRDLYLITYAQSKEFVKVFIQYIFSPQGQAFLAKEQFSGI